MKLNTLKSISSLRLARGHYDLIKLSHSGFSKVFYFINNIESIEYDSNTYDPLNFGIKLESKKDLVGGTLIIANIDRQIEKELAGALTAPNEDITCEHLQITVERDILGDLEAGLVSNLREYQIVKPKVTKESINASLVLKNSLQYNLSSLVFNNKTDFPNINI